MKSRTFAGIVAAAALAACWTACAKTAVTPPQIASVAYDGTVKTPAVPPSQDYEVVFSESGEHAGTYDTFLRLADPDNFEWKDFNGAMATVPFAITKAANRWTSGPQISGWMYGETPSVPVATAAFGAVRPVVYSGTTADGAAVAGAAAVSEPGEYTATFEVEGTDDYSGLRSEVAFAVSKRDVSGGDFVVSVGPNLKYNGAEQSLEIKSVKYDGEPIPYSATGGKAKNAGTYTLVVSASGNYTGSTNIEWKILPRAVTLTSGSASKVYDGGALRCGDVAVSGDGFVAGEGATFNVTGSRTSVGSGDNAFTYTLKSGTLAANYTITSVKGRLTVTKAANAWTVQPSVTGKTFDGTPVQYSVGKAKFGTPSVTFSPGGSAVPVEAGDYTAVFSVPGTANYSALSKTLEFTIGPKEDPPAPPDPPAPTPAVLAAEADWKLLRATGTYFAQLRVVCTEGYETGISNLRVCFADMAAGGKTLAQLWDSSARSAVSKTVKHEGTVYRAVELAASQIEGENATAAYGVSSLAASTIPVAERTIELYVPKRDLASHLADYVAYLLWESNGETFSVPVENKSVR